MKFTSVIGEVLNILKNNSQKDRQLNYSSEEDKLRFAIFKLNYEEILEHNEKYARGVIYYPRYSDYTLDETPEEALERIKRPVH